MPKSARLRAQDVHRIHSLVGECRELGDDAAVWRPHWFAGLGRLLRAGIVLGGELAGVRAGRPTALGSADWGWANGFNRQGWDRALAELAANPSLSHTLALADYLRHTLADDGVALSRADYVADSYWYRSWEFENLQRSIGVDHSMYCFRSLRGTTDEFNAVLLCRAVGDPDFSAREKAILREAQCLLSPLVGGPLARCCEPSPSALPQRVRQVLKCILEGDGDKQIAYRLGISRHTVNDHTKAIFRHFGVAGRTELLARWIRRGWGSTFAWAPK